MWERRQKTVKVTVKVLLAIILTSALRTVPTNGKYFFPDNDNVRQVNHIGGY